MKTDDGSFFTPVKLTFSFVLVITDNLFSQFEDLVSLFDIHKEVICGTFIKKLNYSCMIAYS